MSLPHFLTPAAFMASFFALTSSASSLNRSMHCCFVLPGMDSAILSHLLGVSFPKVMSACSSSFCSSDVQGTVVFELVSISGVVFELVPLVAATEGLGVVSSSYRSDGAAEIWMLAASFPPITLSAAVLFDASFRLDAAAKK